MSGSPFAAADVQHGAKRRSFPGSKPANELSENQISVTASTSQPAAKLFTSRHASKYGKILRREGPLVGLLATGTGMVLLNQVITDQDIADGSVQVLAWVKYGAIYFAACLAARTDPAKADHSREQYILMAIIGLTDVFAYAANCLGVAFCGATRAALILAATQQVFTAVLSYILLGRRLSSQQVSGVAVVCLGLALQGLAPEPALAAGLTTAATPAPSDRVLKLLGLACMLLSSLSYSFLGVSYDLLVRSEGATPTHSEVMFYTAKIGLGLNTLYQLMWTLPQWDSLVTKHMASHNTSMWHAVALLLAFGALFHVHSYVQGLVYRTEGAVGVALVNAIRGGTVSLLTGALFCSSAASSSCLNAWSACSAAVETAGGITWLTATHKKGRRVVRKDSTRLQVLIGQSSLKQALQQSVSFRHADG
ncbi:hypothetical protein WJX82_008967 [Trebouxia sp. C0006]